MMKIYAILLSTIFCCNVFAQNINNEEWNENFPAEFIAKYEEALEYCSNIKNKRSKLDNKSLKILSTLRGDQLSNFIIYKYEMSMNRCIEDNGGYHIIFLVNYISNKKTTEINKEIANTFFQIISNPRVLASLNFDKDMSDEKKKELKSIKYLDTPFNGIRVYEQIKEAQAPGELSAKLNFASPLAKKTR